MDRLYWGIQQQNKISVVCGMLGQAWIRHWKQGSLVGTIWLQMWGTIVVHMLYMLCMLHLWYCAHALLCIHRVCTCFLWNLMYRMLRIVLCEYSIWSAGYRWCYVHDGYVVLCTYGVVHMLDMQCYVHVGYVVLCVGGVACMLYMWRYVHMVLCTCCTSGIMCRRCCVHFLYVVLCTYGVEYMSCVWYCLHVVLCICYTVVQSTCGNLYTLCRWCVYMWCCAHIL